jgi:outer membrane receptor protein involved in Fe transport
VTVFDFVFRRRLCASALAIALGLVLAAAPAIAQDSAQQPDSAGSAGQPPAPPVFTSAVSVVGTTPLRDAELPLTMIPFPVQTATDRTLEQTGTPDVASFLNRRMTSVHVNEIQGNPFQVDVNYRGYTASPLAGTPQGLSLYMDGMRLNQPFGDIVSWDLIPRIAIGSMTLMPGSNPLFGLNTLGGALVMETKTGRSHPGTSVSATYGTAMRRTVDFEHGGAREDAGLDWYVAGSYYGNDGWRDASPSAVRQLFGKLRWAEASTDAALTAAFADNELTGNGLQDERLLERDYTSVYTKPDTTDDRSLMLNFTGHHRYGARSILTATVYVRRLDTSTFNGDINEESLDGDVYQPDSEERAALSAAGYMGVPERGASADNTPFPSWRCLADVLLREEAAETCNGLLNRTASRQTNAGASAEYTRRETGRVRHQFTAGAAYDWSTTGFLQSVELGYINPDRSVTGTGAFAVGLTGGSADEEAFDGRVDLDGRTQTVSVYATDTLTLAGRWHLTASGRFNRTDVRNRDRITPGGAAGSLDGDHGYSRFNPSVGLAVDLPFETNGYGSYSEASRAPTSIELGCADPAMPCKLPNAMAGDPPLEQVVARTWEAGIRGGRRFDWRAGVFRANNENDIVFAASGQTGFGYFTNFGETRRQGLELGGNGRFGAVTLGAGYTFLDATYQSDGTFNGESNSTNSTALEDQKGFEGEITVRAGDRIPLVPRHQAKAFADVAAGRGLSLHVDLVAASGSFARGNENNAHRPDGIYYLGPGRTDGYAVFNVNARQRLASRVEIFVQIDNLFDRRYATAAQLGPAGFTTAGAFLARPLPAVDGEYPIQGTTFFAPGAPRTIWAGARLTM